jgi:uncharacterized membrane protein YukC
MVDSESNLSPSEISERLKEIEKRLSKLEEGQHGKKNSTENEDKKYIPPGLAKRTTPNTYTMKEWANKFCAK